MRGAQGLQGWGFRVWGLGFIGFGVQSLGFRIEGSGVGGGVLGVRVEVLGG